MPTVSIPISSALSTAVIDSVHYTRKLIDKTGYFMLSLPSLAIARETLYLGSVSKFDEADKIEKSGAKLFKFEGCDIPTQIRVSSVCFIDSLS